MLLKNERCYENWAPNSANRHSRKFLGIANSLNMTRYRSSGRLRLAIALAAADDLPSGDVTKGVLRYRQAGISAGKMDVHRENQDRRPSRNRRRHPTLRHRYRQGSDQVQDRSAPRDSHRPKRGDGVLHAASPIDTAPGQSRRLRRFGARRGGFLRDSSHAVSACNAACSMLNSANNRAMVSWFTGVLRSFAGLETIVTTYAARSGDRESRPVESEGGCDPQLTIGQS